jgi:hypothetical protein
MQIFIRLPREGEECVTIETAAELLAVCERLQAEYKEYLAHYRPKTSPPTLAEAEAVLEQGRQSSYFLEPIGECGAFSLYSMENNTGYPKPKPRKNT